MQPEHFIVREQHYLGAVLGSYLLENHHLNHCNAWSSWRVKGNTHTPSRLDRPVIPVVLVLGATPPQARTGVSRASNFFFPLTITEFKVRENKRTKRQEKKNSFWKRTQADPDMFNSWFFEIGSLQLTLR